MEDEHKIKLRSLYIDMDLAPCRSPNSTSTARRKSMAESDEDFEFTMSHVSLQNDLSDVQAVRVASADKLLFRAQSLPLQQTSKARATQQPILQFPTSDADDAEVLDDDNALSTNLGGCMNLHPFNQRQLLYPAMMTGSLRPRDPEKCFHSDAERSTDIPLQWSSSGAALHYTSVTQLENEEIASSDLCRNDPVQLGLLQDALNFYPNEFRSSNFQSRHGEASFWSYIDKEAKAGSSSSRCNKGSYGESACLRSANKKPLPNYMSMQRHAGHLGISNCCSTDHSESRSRMGSANHPVCSANLNRLEPPCGPSLRSRRWRWNCLFAFLQKASKLWLDAGRGRSAEGGKRAIFTFKDLPDPLSDTESSCSSSQRRAQDWEWQKSRYKLESCRERAGKKPEQPASGHGRRDGRIDFEVGAIFDMRREGSRAASCNGGDVGPTEEMKAQGQIKVCSARERVKNRIRRMKKSGGNGSRRMTGEDVEEYEAMKGKKSQGSTPLAKSPVRGVQSCNLNNDASLSGSCAKTSRGRSKTAQFIAASCPASLASSPPHHTSAIARNIDRGTLDLHSAIQGAIAHCKQSANI